MSNSRVLALDIGIGVYWRISKIHYYTKEQKSSVSGTEDVSITPFTFDMSASKDGIVTRLTNKLIVQTHLMTIKEYSVHRIDYAINLQVSEQWIPLDDSLLQVDGHDLEDVDDMETDDEEPVRKVRQAIHNPSHHKCGMLLLLFDDWNKALWLRRKPEKPSQGSTSTIGGKFIKIEQLEDATFYHLI
ncbi:hypothetical protein Tco_1474464 [Tanacetum coccineum]